MKLEKKNSNSGHVKLWAMSLIFLLGACSKKNAEVEQFTVKVPTLTQSNSKVVATDLNSADVMEITHALEFNNIEQVKEFQFNSTCQSFNPVAQTVEGEVLSQSTALEPKNSISFYEFLPTSKMVDLKKAAMFKCQYSVTAVSNIGSTVSDKSDSFVIQVHQNNATFAPLAWLKSLNTNQNMILKKGRYLENDLTADRVLFSDKITTMPLASEKDWTNSKIVCRNSEGENSVKGSELELAELILSRKRTSVSPFTAEPCRIFLFKHERLVGFSPRFHLITNQFSISFPNGKAIRVLDFSNLAELNGPWKEEDARKATGSPFVSYSFKLSINETGKTRYVVKNFFAEQRAGYIFADHTVSGLWKARPQNINENGQQMGLDLTGEIPPNGDIQIANSLVPMDGLCENRIDNIGYYQETVAPGGTRLLIQTFDGEEYVTIFEQALIAEASDRYNGLLSPVGSFHRRDFKSNENEIMSMQTQIFGQPKRVGNCN